jgi:hypothetical protein
LSSKSQTITSGRRDNLPVFPKAAGNKGEPGSAPRPVALSGPTLKGPLLASRRRCRHWAASRHPVFAGHRVSVKDRPDRAAAIVAVADSGHRGVDPIVWPEGDLPGVQIAALASRTACQHAVGRQEGAIL